MLRKWKHYQDAHIDESERNALEKAMRQLNADQALEKLKVHGLDKDGIECIDIVLKSK